MAVFETAKAVTNEFEGGFWDDPSAGWTYAGITRDYYPEWPGFQRLVELRNLKFGGRAIPRYTKFDDALLNAHVKEFYKKRHWSKLINGDKIINQITANLLYDFVVHKEYDAIATVNQAVKSFAKNPVDTSLYTLTDDVINQINKGGPELYKMLRQARIDYYTGSKKGKGGRMVKRFSTGMAAAFVKRTKKFPESISTATTNKKYVFNFLNPGNIKF
jgi:lysozyme family protein